MSQKIHSQDSNSDSEFKGKWEEMELIEPLTPIKHEIKSDVEDSKRAFLDAAKEYDRLMGK